MDGISSFFQRLPAVLRKIFADIVSGPRTLWDLSAGYPISRKTLIGGAILAAVTILSLLVYYLRCVVRKKRENPMALIVVLALICSIFVLGARMKPSEAKPVTIDGVKVLSCDSYSLARGYMIYSPKNAVFFFNGEWRFVNDSFSFLTDDNTLIQLSGLRSLCEKRCYAVTAAVSEESVPGITLSCETNDNNGWLSAELDVYILKDRDLKNEPWFLGAGDSVRSGSFAADFSESDYHVLENDGETLTFLMTLEDRYLQPVAVCMAWQDGADIVAAVSTARKSDISTGDPESFDPSVAGQRNFLLEPLRNLYDGRVRVIQNPDEELLSLALPEKIINCPPWLLDRGVSLTIPCDRLISMSYDFNGNQIMRFTGAGPDGSSCKYTLVNGTFSDRAEHWNQVYKLDKTAVDNAMSEFLGAKAVACDDGWIIKMGTYLIQSDYDHYYHLAFEPFPTEQTDNAEPAETPA